MPLTDVLPEHTSPQNKVLRTAKPYAGSRRNGTSSRRTRGSLRTNKYTEMHLDSS